MTNPSGTGLTGSLRALGATLIELVCARAELIVIELQEERALAGRKLVLAVLAALFLAMGLLLVALLVVVLYWDTHRILAAVGVTALYLGIGAAALVRLRQIRRDGPPPFAATLNEFAHDLRLLRDRDE